MLPCVCVCVCVCVHVCVCVCCMCVREREREVGHCCFVSTRNVDTTSHSLEQHIYSQITTAVLEVLLYTVLILEHHTMFTFLNINRCK